jgi:hypothetical protein
MSFCLLVRNGKPRGAPGRASAAVAIFALLLHAIVYAAHHHPLPFSPRHAPGLAGAAAGAGPDLPLSADRECQICFALGHHGAVPVDAFAAALPEEKPFEQIRTAAVSVSRLPYLLFQPRAPPRG